MLPCTQEVDAATAVFVVSEAITWEYFAVALLVALVYHSIITFENEVKYFWVGRIDWFRLLNLTKKPSPSHAVRRTGRISDWVGSLANITTIVLIDYILLIRVLALYHQSKKLSHCMKLLLGFEATMGLAMSIYGKLFAGFLVITFTGGITICGTIKSPPQTLGIISWTVPMSYGILLLSLVIFKVIQFYRISSGFRGFHLVRVLALDQIMYSSLVIFCFVLKIMTLSIETINPLASNLLNALGSPTLLCILGGQLLINLKEAGSRDVNGGTDYTPRSLSNIDFGEHNVDNEHSTEQEGHV
ncbi:hypothetical protein A7U60_g9150 [Sanghuangporus baumii]|uniref:DUF6533 domain-containing protein n=1 Tax=Sanghuangporus baumii TaxID=108892 RepID=A0A9Q5N2F1_SANBA|nr:hypothetical protein A7U60_g9150 [Sanghuangporus baumii]